MPPTPAKPAEPEPEDAPEDNAEPDAKEQPRVKAPSPAPSAETDDRWAGTMSRDWNEPEHPDGPTVAENAPASSRKAKSRAAKPKVTMEDAIAAIPVEALEYVRKTFKTDVGNIRAYDPLRNVKNPVVIAPRKIESAEEGDEEAGGGDES